MTAYTYDDLGRLTNETETASGSTLSKTYAYDTAGNRATMTVSGSESYTTAYDYDDNNRLTTETKDTGLTTEAAEYQYDNNGNQISKTTFTVGNAAGNAAVGIYILGLHRPTPREDYTIELNAYDGFNRLTQVLNDEGTSVYAYKADGLRLSKDANGEKTTHVWDNMYTKTLPNGIVGSTGSHIIVEIDGNGNISAEYLYGIGLIARETPALGREYYLFNAHGDVVQLTNSSGALVKSYQYDAFGVEKDIDENDTNPFRYSGEYYDSSSGTYYLRNRYYNPSTGAFMSEDPIRDGLNWYTYALSNPVLYIDPFGLYDRQKAVDYVLTWYNSHNPDYLNMENKLEAAAYFMDFHVFLGLADCTNFTSQ